jgi:hypothetical protein
MMAYSALLAGALALIFGLGGHQGQRPARDCFPSTAGVDDFKTDWFCSQLAAAGEGLLPGEHSYRFTYIPSFHATRIVVVTETEGQWTVVGKVLSGRGGYEPGTLARTTKRALTAAEARLLENRLANAGMWEPTDKNPETGVDGAEWVLEGRRTSRYAFHDVWSPTDRTFPQYRRVCIFLLQLADILPSPKKQELY